MFKKLSKLGQALMLPISILPVAGLLLGIGGALSNPATIEMLPFLDQVWLQAIFQVMNAAGNAVFSNLPLIFAIGIPVGLADAEKGTAGLSGGVAYLVFSGSITILTNLFIGEDANLDTGVVAAFVIGLVVTYLHNNYRKIQLPDYLGFFGGNRFIPIISSFAAIFIAVIFFLIWPPIQQLIVNIGVWIAGLGSIGSFLYGFLLRLTGAVGLHHAVYPMFWYTALGGTEVVAGETVSGAQNIFFAQLADPTHEGLFTYGTRFFAGRFATMMFGLPAAGLAMLHSIPKNRREEFKGLYIGNGFTSFLTGITEPLEYSFLFVAPWLYVIHAFLDGLSFFFADILNIRIGNTFSGGLIDFLLFGVLQGNSHTNWVRVIPLGLIWALIYYVVFRFCIKKFHVPIPGLVEEDSGAKAEPTKKGSEHSDLSSVSLEMIDALGGEENIENVTACATRLRVSVTDPSKVNKDTFKKHGASGVLEVDGGIQAIFGGKSDLYSQEINEIIGEDER